LPFRHEGMQSSRTQPELAAAQQLPSDAGPKLC
jgi:hypothetical protein